MSDSKGFYAILGLQEGASVDDIKKAYKKKQIELHPSGPARKKVRDSAEYKALSEEQQKAKETELDEKVAKVNEAYKVLGDDKRKQEYDAGAGEFAEQGMGGMGGFGGFEDMVSQFMGGGRRQRNKVKDIETEINITYKDVFLGKTNKYRIKIQKICKACEGLGGKEFASCARCKGEGIFVTKVSIGGLFTTQQRVECPECEGKGKKISGPKCTECKGEKTISESNIMEVSIPKGIEDGEMITYKGQGSQLPGYVPGDLVFAISIKDDPKFKRVENDFICPADIDVLTALTGGVIYFNHPDGRNLAVKVVPFKDFDSSIVIPGEGFRNKNTGKNGNLYIKPNVIINSGLDRARLSEYLKPLLSKPSGEFTPINSTLGKAPVVYDDDESSRRGQGRRGDGFFHGGHGGSEYFSFF